MQERISLNDHWFFYPEIGDYQSSRPRPEKMPKELVDLPHTVKMMPYNNFYEADYQFRSLYRKEIFIGEEFRDKAIFLEFEGVANMAMVSINGRESFRSESPYLPFSKEINKELRLGENNIIEVLVDSNEIDSIPPFGEVVDFLSYGGIYREVSLLVKSPYFIQNVFAFSGDILLEEKSLTIQTCLSSYHGGNLIYKLYDGHGEGELGEALYSCIRDVDDKRVRTIMKLQKITLWDLENPHLYTLEVTLVDKNGNAVDKRYETIGFRKAQFKEDGFYLNGRKVKILGLNRHQSYPYVGYAMPKSMQRLDAEILKKDLGVNMVRTSHYPQSRHFLDRCDELGLLVFEEIPGWQFIGDEHFKENSKDNLKKMIKRDRNHPSIVIWGVRINESPDDHVFYSEMNKIAHIYDESRPTGGVRNFAKSEFLEDVYTYNDFLHKGDNDGLSDPTEILPKRAPYLVTEFNGHMYPTKSFDPEERRVEHAMRHVRVLSHMMKDAKISGALGWCMADYNTHGDFGSGDRICYHGVLDMFRQRKLASYVYTSQREDEPVLMISSSMDIGEYPGGAMSTIYAFTNCDHVDVYRNDRFIRRYTREKGQGLSHPPMAMDDLIGNLLMEDEGFSKQDSDRVKKIIKAAAVHGLNLPLRARLSMGIILMKYRLKLGDAVKLFSKYYAGWGQEQITYSFKGIMGDEEVKTVTRGKSSQKYLRIIPDKTRLIHAETYDVAMVSLQALNEHEDVMVYSSEIIQLEVMGNVEILGPVCFPLRGGQGAFYVRSGRGEGDGRVRIKSETMGEMELEFQVSRKDLRRL